MQQPRFECKIAGPGRDWDGGCSTLREVGVKAVVMPALGVAMSEGLLLQWLRSTGDAVAEGEPIVEIETDKSTVEVESPVAGIMGPHLFEPGSVIPVGVEMTRILEAGDEADAASSPASQDASAGSTDAAPVAAPGTSAIG